MNIKQHISLLGLRVEDRVTGLKGIVASISFDLYGCVQAIINLGLDKELRQREPVWLDVNRLKVLSKKPVMEVPNFDFGPQAEGKQGAAEKPFFNKA